jgi:hypothetical protein
MQEWPTEEEEAPPRPSPKMPWRRRWNLRDPQARDNTFVAALALFYAILAGFAAMDIPVHWALRLALAAIGVGMIVGFWGFGPM